MSGERVVFNDYLGPRDGQHLTNAQWIGLFGVVDSRVGWRWAMPERAGDPVRVLPPDEDVTHRFDADGTHYREPFEAEHG